MSSTTPRTPRRAWLRSSRSATRSGRAPELVDGLRVRHDDHRAPGTPHGVYGGVRLSRRGDVLRTAGEAGRPLVLARDRRGAESGGPGSGALEPVPAAYPRVRRGLDERAVRAA